MHSFTLLISLGLVPQSLASYYLQDDYSGDNFFDKMSFFTGNDPTNGYVNYVDYNTAISEDLIVTAGGVVYIGVDNQRIASGRGRDSVRLTSNAAYNHGLVVLDLNHMPGGICGTWPAFWMVGPNWPSEGEIDIIEGVNEQSQNDMTLHTSAGCTVSNNGQFSGGYVTTSNCNVAVQGNAGCQIAASSSATYGTQFNTNGGGVYATEWTSNHIDIWFWQQGSQPADVLGASPDPAGWGTPLASFTPSCNLDSYFQNQQLVFDTTFCGDWAGNVWGSSSCAYLAPSCVEYVQNNPSAFANAFWAISSLKVYQNSGVYRKTVATETANPSDSSSIAAKLSRSAMRRRAADLHTHQKRGSHL